MNNSNSRNADYCKLKNRKPNNGVQNEQNEVQKQAKNKISSFSKVRIDYDKMSDIDAILNLIFIRIIEVEKDYLLDNTLSKSMLLLQKKLHQMD